MASKRCALLLRAMVLIGWLAVPVRGADWPQWRHDASRTAASPEELPAKLGLKWVRQYPPLTPAWPGEARQQIDGTYEPVVMGKTLFFGSSRDDSVTALDTETGAEKWTVRVGGPVRFAPAAANGKVYVGSDDGHLYCLSAADGGLAWKFRGAPAARKVIGHERLISCWPVGGGPVLADGKVYFAAGIWPSEGVFVHALDAETGKVVWTHDANGFRVTTSRLKTTFSSGLTAQGYLAAVGERLLVPSGRAVPACFDRRTGALLYHHYPFNDTIKDGLGGGGPVVTAVGPYFFCGYYGPEKGAKYARPAVYDLATGDWLNTHSPSVLTDAAVYNSAGAHDLTKPTFAEGPYAGGKRKLMTFPRLWSLDGLGVDVHIKAGGRLYGTGGGSVAAVDIPAAGGTPAVSWKEKIDGTPARMIAADGRLFVVTREGRICCFAGGAAGPKVHPPSRPAAPPAADEWAARTAEVLKQTRVTEGYCLVLGIGTGRLLEEIARLSKLHILAVDPDVKKVEAIRGRLGADLYGTRVAAAAGDPLEFGLPPYVASLIVSEDLSAAGFDSGAFAAGVFAALRPYGGVACLPVPAAEAEKFARRVKEAGLANAEVARAGEFTLLRRVGPLPGSADWSHESCGPAGTFTSPDDLVKAPLGVLWFGGPAGGRIYFDRHMRGRSPLVVAGRMFIQGTDAIRAFDAYTGRFLWKSPGLPASRNGHPYLATEDRVYVQVTVLANPAEKNRSAPAALSDPLEPAGPDSKVLVLDAATGDIAARLPFAGGIKVWKDTLLGSLAGKVIASDRHSGKVLWTYQGVPGIGFIAGGGKVFCCEAAAPGEAAQAPRQKGTPEGRTGITALDARTGGVLWRRPASGPPGRLAYSEEHDVLVVQAGLMSAFRGEDGKPLWSSPGGRGGPLMLRGDMIISSVSYKEAGWARNLLTGQTHPRINPLTGERTPWTYRRAPGCGYVIAGKHLLTFRGAFACYYDLARDGGTGGWGGFRSGCQPSLIPADGLLNAPKYAQSCVCNYPLFTALAMVHRPEVETWTQNPYPAGSEPVRRVGINFGAPGDRVAEDGTMWLDWPSVGGPSPDIPVEAVPQAPQCYRRHSSRIGGEGLGWVAASGARGLKSVALRLGNAKPRPYTVRLHFAEPDGLEAGQRVFTVSLQGEQVLKDLDISAEAGGPFRAVVKEIKGVSIGSELRVTFAPTRSEALICGIEVRADP